ncbi:MAG: LysR substrate-binding domain-containing protein [Pseudomonadota bacterium]|nr:LysR family transcriptional regulator [Gammaproteobacteria bacterium]MEE2683947.1 LysR substrate-binding domain-containing protein [Pseudomonadota bacterium]
MNIKDLRYILAVKDTGSFNKAAQICNVTQPTLSGQIKKLEETLGVILFERTTQSIAITEIGEKIIEKARNIIRESEEISELAQSSKNPWESPLKIGIIPTLGPYLLPRFLKQLKKFNKISNLYFVEDMTDSLVDQLNKNKIDAAFLTTTPPDNLNEIKLFHEPFWIAFSSTDPLERLQEVSTKDLDPEKILLLNDGHCLRDQALSFCFNERASSRRFDTRATSLETLINLVSSGEGYTLVPALSIQSAWTTDMGIIVRKLQSPEATRTIRLVFRKTFPRIMVIKKIAKLINSNLPNTVKLI